MTRAIPSLIAALLVAGCAVVPEPEGPSTAVPYRALGTEPFWSLVLDGGRATFESPDAAPVVLPLPPGRASFNGMRHVGDRIVIDITHSPCSDGMSDRRYADTVMVAIDGRDLRGCGGAVLPPEDLAGTRWIIRRIDGRAVTGPPERPAELAFADGRIAVGTGCNRMGGSYRVEGARLVTGPLASTRMACPQPMMGQEDALGALFAAGATLRFTPEGALLLSGGGHSVEAEQVI